MKKQIITLTVAALTLSSCGIYTQYKPATEVPDNLYGEEVAVADTVDNIGNLSWQEIFTDPRLQELIEQGLRNNTDLQSAQWRVKEAEAAMLSAKLAYRLLSLCHLRGQQVVLTKEKLHKLILYQSRQVGKLIFSAASVMRNARRKHCWNRAVTINRLSGHS